MEYFLERIARYLYDNHAGEMRKQCLVFPSRRAGVYFLRYLSDLAVKPLWAPAVMTINEFFASLSGLHIPEKEILVAELYKSYRTLRETPESFDDFYFWGEMLINDFDDTDKYLADAKTLFRNVLDLKDIDFKFGGLDEEQAEIIRQFWNNFEPHKPTREKDNFISIWSILPDLYNLFRKNLRENSLAYEGMIFRDLTDKIISGNDIQLIWDNVYFMGFNAINRCEEVLMKWLETNRKGRFFWDYDNSYIEEKKYNSAGFFLRKNLKQFRDDMPDDWSYDTFISSPAPLVKRRVIETTSDVAQVKLIPYLLNNLPDLSPGNNHHTAIILADEELLIPVLTSLPEDVGDVNITMGYPLRQSDIYSLLKNMIELQRNLMVENTVTYFDHRNVNSILKHSLAQHLLTESSKMTGYITKLNLVKVPDALLEETDRSGLFFKKADNPEQLSDYFKQVLLSLQPSAEGADHPDNDKPVRERITGELVFRTLLSLKRLDNLINDPEIKFTTSTYLKILDNILKSQSVPFTGEPLSGIQIMGLLESRTLDFRNIIMLSVNENIMPGISSGSSFIPYAIREAFGLPSVNHQESLYAYHFYRLLHRAENVTFIYNSNSDGLITGEMSRFLLQMRYEEIFNPELFTLDFEIQTPAIIVDRLEKRPEHIQHLYNQFISEKEGGILSPTAVNTWLNCRMRFFYRYVNRIKEPDRITSEIDQAVFGSLLHEVMRKLYEDHIGEEISVSLLDSLIAGKQLLASAINDSAGRFFGLYPSASRSGDLVIIQDILLIYLIRILEADRSYAPFLIRGLEEPYAFTMSCAMDNEVKMIRTGGNIDRIDWKSGMVRVVDYKTGNIAEKINSVFDLFADDRDKDLDGWLQTLLYCEAFLSRNPGTTVKPSIYKVRRLSGSDNADALKLKAGRGIELLIDDYAKVRNEFMEGLTATVKFIFSIDEPFIMTGNENKCRYCPYRGLCMR